MSKRLLLLVGIGALVVVYLMWGTGKKAEDTSYNPVIDPSAFSADITNPYFRLPVGRKLNFEEQTADGLEKIEITIENGTKVVMGVTTAIYRDTVHVNGVLVEDTRDYLAQDAEGNVWYFGEEVDNYENGVLADHAGSWLAGVDGAKPGIWIKAKHTVGDSYRQEYYAGVAEDTRDVVAVGLTVKTNVGTYTDCVQMYDWTPLDVTSRENKYYCPSVGALVVTENVETGERAELVRVSTP